LLLRRARRAPAHRGERQVRPLRARRPREPVSRAHSEPLGLASGELDDLVRLLADRRAPRLEARDDLDDDLVLVDEHDVDRETHEERVHRPLGPEHEALAWLEALAPQKPARAPPEGVRESAALADHASVVLAAEDDLSGAASHVSG